MYLVADLTLLLRNRITRLAIEYLCDFLQDNDYMFANSFFQKPPQSKFVKVVLVDNKNTSKFLSCKMFFVVLVSRRENIPKSFGVLFSSATALCLLYTQNINFVTYGPIIAQNMKNIL